MSAMTYAAPARTAHGPIYWLIIGWWWGPIKWAARVVLWVFVWPLGLWRSLAHGRKVQNSKERRGARG